MTWLAIRLSLGSAVALGLARFAFGLVVPAMRDELGWSLADAGLQTTANGIGYLAGAVVVAMVVRRLGTARSFQLGMVIATSSLAATAATSAYPLLMVLRATAGLAGALVFVAGAVVAARLGSATTITIYFAGAGVGIAASGLVLPHLLDGQADRWPWAWVFLAAGALLATAVSWTAVTCPADGTANKADKPARLRGLRLIGATYVLFAAGYIAYLTFLSAYLAGLHSTASQVAATWVVLGVGAVLGPLLWSRAISTWPGGLPLATLVGLQSVAAALPLAHSGRLPILASAAVVGATFLNVPAAVTTLVRGAVPAENLTSTLGALTALFAAGQTAGPWLAGVLADHLGAAAALAWTVALCAAGALCAACWRPTISYASKPARSWQRTGRRR